MADLLRAHAGLEPEKPGLIEDEHVVSWQQRDERANRAANALAGLGVAAGDRVAIMALNSVAGFEVSGGLGKLEAIGVPVNFRLRGAELAYILNDSGARVICAGPEFVEHLEAARPAVGGARVFTALAGAPTPPGWLSFEEQLAAASPEQPEAPDMDGFGATMIYTSGTTGHPKGAFRPHGVPLEHVMGAIQMFGLRPDDVHLMAGPGYHSAVAFFCGLTTAIGGTIVIMRRFDPEAALVLIQRHQVTTTFMAPTLLHRIMDLPEEIRRRHDVSSVRAVILGAAPCPFSLKERATAYFGEVLYEFYGATETGINLLLRPEDQLRKPGSAGRPPEGQEILLLDDDGNPVRDGVPGELWARSDWLATYYNKPDATARAMREGFFSVGDVAYRDEEGFYYICDRKIDMIISAGVNIYPAEVEACLHGHPAVADVAVIGVPDDRWGEAVKAVVTLLPDREVGEQELIDWCRGRIADYKRPRSVDFVAELPRDMAGKLLKREIRQPYWAETGRRI
jgi:fatty-acyl-CoA synthase/long-chain acyl-CoA synthetase